MMIRPISSAYVAQELIYEQERRDERERIASRNLDEEYHENLDHREELIRMNRKRDKVNNRRSGFFQSVKSCLVTDALDNIMESCMSKELSCAEASINMRSLVSQFVNENGADKVIRSMSATGGPLMTETAAIINRYYKRIMHENEECEPGELCVDHDTQEEFHQELDDTNPDSVTEQIRQRVSTSMQDWMQQNAEDKEKIKQTLDMTNDQMQKYSDDQEVQESYARMGKQHIGKIRNKEHGLFHNMVESAAKSVLKDPKKHKEYTSNGKLDMKKIVESCETAYTFMEAVASLRLVNRDDMAQKIMTEFCIK